MIRVCCGISHSFQPRRIAILLGALFSVSTLTPALAAGEEVVLGGTVVSATRTEAQADSVAATVTSVNRQTMDRRLPHDEAALLQDEPDVVISRDLRRFGASTVNIRGIEGNRVLQMVDGVRLPDTYNGGGPTNTTSATSDSPELNFLKRVEILRGPASSLYGSDALGGVVGYLTLDPRDILGDRKLAGRYKGSWRQADNSLQNTFYLAAAGDAVESLVVVTRRKGREMDNQGSVGGTGVGRELPNPQDTRSDGVLAKLAVTPAAGQRIRFAFEGRSQDNSVDILRLSPSLPKVTSSSGNESVDRQRISADWEWKPTAGWLDRVFLSAYHQESENRTYTLQQRSATTGTCSAVSSGTNNCRIDMNFLFEQESRGLGLQLERSLPWGSTLHQLVAGADWRNHRVSELRDYTVTNQTTNTVSKTLAGDTFPLKDFAPGQSTSLGLFVQDEIVLLDGRLTITPALRHDQVELKPDATSKQIGNTLFAAANQSHSAFSPKLSALWQAAPDITLYGQVVRGFRAPNYSEVNGLFWNTAQAYATIPNPGLKPEKSLGLEIGTRLKALGGDLKFALFDNRYDDFISHEKACTSPAGTCLGNLRTVYQYVNLAKVRIHGAEVRGAWTLPGNFKLDGALAYAQGDVTSSNQPLNSVEPMRLSLGLNWEGGLANQPVGLETRLRAAAGKSRVDTTNGDYFRPGRYAAVDVSAWWQVNPKARLNLAVNNLFDRQYWLWSDVRQAGLTPTDAGAAFYTQPGRNLSASLQVDF